MAAPSFRKAIDVFEQIPNPINDKITSYLKIDVCLIWSCNFLFCFVCLFSTLALLNQIALCSRCIYQRRHFGVFQSLWAGGKWRERHGLARNPTQDYGPLVDLPDWSYEDGRPAPPTKRQLFNQQIRREIAEKIDIYSREMLEAKEKYIEKQQEHEKIEDKVRKSRLKPKGPAWKS
ncbi:large ribosomal subunit protein mL52-like [Ptychodera flava]|uniref:large ribosomal subunit protein mL52-like n=1 Tax=Ptychodera flava TaxID=63121 RepID=UPI00396A8E58